VETLQVEQNPQSKQSAGYSPRPAKGSSSLIMDLIRILMIVLALVVAAGFILIIVPQVTFNRAAQNLQERRGKAIQEQIALLYLGDEIKDQRFYIHGVVRNITTQPIEKIDAAVRLYSMDGSLAETDLVRMNKETIAPDETAEFQLVYPNYNSQFGSYAVDFKTRDGDTVFYRDMRATQGSKQTPP
jgi:hypothetical protein